MNSSTYISPFLAFSFLLLFHSVAAFNVTTMLEKHSDLSNFNDFLTQTKLADEINHRKTITILAVDNGAISALSGKSQDMIKQIVSVHIVLDYYDMEKIKKLSDNKSALLTTLFQSTGMATNQQGFINITVPRSGNDIRLGSAVPGSDHSSSLMKSVDAKPFDISILQISSAIIPPGIDNATVHAPPPKKEQAPSPAHKSHAPAPSTKSKPPSSAPRPLASGPASRKGGSPSPSAVTAGASSTHITLGTCLLVVMMGVVCMAAI